VTFKEVIAPKLVIPVVFKDRVPQVPEVEVERLLKLDEPLIENEDRELNKL
jgi:hypothetical protein